MLALTPFLSASSLLLLLSVRSAQSFPVVATLRTRTQLDASVGIYFGTVGGNTKTCANHIMNAAEADNEITLCEIENLKDPKAFSGHDALIIGAPTWNTGAEKERTLTGWDSWLYNVLPTLDLKSKRVALFGVGDQGDYPFNFCDAVGELYSEFTKAGCDVNYGRTSTEGYMHVNSKAQVDEDKPIFYGLVMDENTQPDQSQPRAQAWIEQLKSEGFF